MPFSRGGGGGGGSTTVQETIVEGAGDTLIYGSSLTVAPIVGYGEDNGIELPEPPDGGYTKLEFTMFWAHGENPTFSDGEWSSSQDFGHCEGFYVLHPGKNPRSSYRTRHYNWWYWATNEVEDEDETYVDSDVGRLLIITESARQSIESASVLKYKPSVNKLFIESLEETPTTGADLPYIRTLNVMGY